MGEHKRSLVRRRREQPPEREPFSVLDAGITHGVDLTFRLFIGLIAGLMGIFMLWLLLTGAPEAVRRGGFERIGSPWLFVLLALIGAMLSAFAVGQVLQIAWVGGDQGYDQRLWARMTSRERGQWRLREAASGRWTFRLFLLLALCGVVYSELHLRLLLQAEVLAGRWPPVAGLVIATLVLAGLAVWSFARRSSPMSGPAWVSQGRWVSVIRGVTVTDIAVALVAGIGLPAMGWIKYANKPNDPDTIDMVVAGAVGLLICTWCLIAAWRDRRAPPTRIEIVRETDKPLVLACTLTLPLPPEEVARGDWLARFVASTSKYPSINADRNWGRWLDVTAAVGIVKGTSSVRFRFHIDMPKDPPYWRATWMIRLESPSGRNKPLTLMIPEQVVLSEEYPAA